METLTSSYSIRLSYRKGKRMANLTLHCSSDCASFARNLYDDSINIIESVYCIFTNCRNETVGYMKLSQGGTSSSVIDNKIVCKAALDLLADGVVLIHNHPSGDPHPSTHDIRQTESLKAALGLFDIRLIDHVILGRSMFYSFADNGSTSIGS